MSGRFVRAPGTVLRSLGGTHSLLQVREMREEEETRAAPEDQEHLAAFGDTWTVLQVSEVADNVGVVEVPESVDSDDASAMLPYYMEAEHLHRSGLFSVVVFVREGSA